MRILCNFYDRSKSWFINQYDLQAGLGFLWWPVWLACGVAAYFALPVEPPGFVVGFAVLSALSLFALLRQSSYAVLLWAFVLIATGFVAATVRTQAVHTPILKEDIGYTTVSGRLKDFEILNASKTQARFIIAPDFIEDLSAEEMRGLFV